jgi:hypothetical protein
VAQNGIVSTKDSNMRTLVRNRFLSSCCCLLSGLTVLALSAQAQVSSRLQLQTIQLDGAAPVAFTFVDQGTGATNYSVEFRPGLETGAAWESVTNAVITPQGGGNYSVQINSPRGERGFYRVVGLGASGGPIIIEFSTVAFQVVEGDTVLPMLVLSQPFNGIVYYTVSGTAMSGDYVALSGQVMVNGTTATIPVSLTDNDMIGQLKYLTLRLDAGAGYELGAGTSTTIFIEENDAEWQGSFVTDDAALGFVLSIRESNGVGTATLKGDGTGFFPATEVPASLNFTANNFAATVLNIPISAEATLLNEPISLTLHLNAMNSVADQSVSPTFVMGAGSLTTAFPAQPHLNTTNTGTFSLLRPPVAPSTNQVELVNAP